MSTALGFFFLLADADAEVDAPVPEEPTAAISELELANGAPEADETIGELDMSSAVKWAGGEGDGKLSLGGAGELPGKERPESDKSIEPMFSGSTTLGRLAIATGAVWTI